MNEYLNVIFNNYANFSGRARRREYWIFTGIHFLIVAMFLIFLYLEFAANKSEQMQVNIISILTLAPVVIYMMIIIVPLLAVSVRRLHDMGNSGNHIWPIFFPATSALIMVLALFDSQPGANRWGPNPKGVEAPAQAF